MHVYMMVTKDEYELPVAIADTAPELARMVGTTENSIRSWISHSKNGGYRSPYCKVEIDEENEDENGKKKRCLQKG